MTSEDSLSRRFLALSSEATAFSVFDLHGTGQAECYLSAVVRVVGEETLTELLDAYDRAAGAAGDAGALRAEIFSNDKLGPVARNIIKLWYAGIWYELPPEWSESFGARENDGTFTASSQAYPEGLLWRAIGANPPGAKAPGYGSWAFPPVFPPIPGEETAPAATQGAPALAAFAEVPSQWGPLAQPLVTDNAKETAR
jgi:hypothetical protein